MNLTAKIKWLLQSNLDSQNYFHGISLSLCSCVSKKLTGHKNGRVSVPWWTKWLLLFCRELHFISVGFNVHCLYIYWGKSTLFSCDDDLNGNTQRKIHSPYNYLANFSCISSGHRVYFYQLVYHILKHYKNLAGTSPDNNAMPFFLLLELWYDEASSVIKCIIIIVFFRDIIAKFLWWLVAFVRL